ncbi:hypothetical protein DYB34_011115 [Aphanomyces astaci]|uniref:Uncharacterized protein n=1 Tax=Aphanomyces astaci TaxID=112090 RepID=A0A396ZU77_APHAT|nr:hypothetical protein DYB36_010996 [Aphanomyces astaci]RHY66314.1 hypothetical protein DYB34_011115 [Aphanomyces astaci]RHZ16412.1 hypothetical protein DYB31_002968 [Aphanomyces astaci]
MCCRSLLASTAATTDGSTGSEDPSLAQYRERAFLPAALGVAAAMGLACVFLLVLLVKCCLTSRVYSMCEKIVTMLLMLAFALLSDVVKVPPLATPDDSFNTPQRYDFAALFQFQGLMDLQAHFDPANPTVLESLFSWDESIVTVNANLLTTLVEGNHTTPSPYAATSFNFTTNQSTVVNMFNSTWPTLTPVASAAQNQRIAAQWLVCATFEARRRELLLYITDVNHRIAGTRPVLDAIQTNSSLLEALEYQLKADMEFFTTQMQAFKLADCGFRGNCGAFT